MTTYFISRHAGAIAWAESEGFHVDQQLAHLDIEHIHAGSGIVTLPVNLIAQVNVVGRGISI